MLGHGWLTLKQAQEAIRAGRLDDAYELLGRPEVQGHKKCWELSHQLMLAYIARGQQHLRQNDTAAAWADLLRAEQIGITDSAPLRLRQELTQRGMAEVAALLDAGEAGRAVEAIAQLKNRAVRRADLDALEEGAREWVAARECTDRGEFARAREKMERVRRVLPAHARAADDFRCQIDQRSQTFEPLLVEVHRAAQGHDWQEVLRLSEKILAQAPQHAEVRRLRARAWKAVEPETLVNVAPPRDKKAEAPAPARSARFILWIDGIGGFLVCLENRVTLGQAGPECLCDIPLQADVSRMHAALTRDSEGYLLEALRPVHVNNAPAEKVLLRSGQRLTLGTSCQLQFRQDVPISASARLDVVSGHRFGLAVDGVLLMAETLVLGPGSQVHVSVPGLKSPLMLYRNKEEIGVRSAEKLWINGQPAGERAILEPGGTLQGAEFSLAMEPLGKAPGSA